MTPDINTVKQVITRFVNGQFDQNYPIPDKYEKMNINASLFELQNHFYKLIKRYNINGNTDSSIISRHILQHLHMRDVDFAYRPCDYQFNFMYHLAERYNEREPLFQLIDSFIRRFKHELTGADLVMTKSGATRCKTNIRFALNGLRELGLVLNNKNDRRCWSPSILGLIALLNNEYSKDLHDNPGWKTSNTLRTRDTDNKKIAHRYNYDPTLMASLSQFQKDPMHLYVFLDLQEQHALNDDEKALLQSIAGNYISFVGDSLEITPGGVRKKKDFIEKSKVFQEELYAINSDNEPFFQKLLAHFQGTISKKEPSQKK